jgi:hypothetical protein
MARATYHCPRCQRDWQGMSPKTARLGVCWPVTCCCGEIPTLTGITEVTISDVKPKSASIEIVQLPVGWLVRHVDSAGV